MMRSNIASISSVFHGLSQGRRKGIMKNLVTATGQPPRDYFCVICKFYISTLISQPECDKLALSAEKPWIKARNVFRVMPQ